MEAICTFDQFASHIHPQDDCQSISLLWLPGRGFEWVNENAEPSRDEQATLFRLPPQDILLAAPERWRGAELEKF